MLMGSDWQSIWHSTYTHHNNDDPAAFEAHNALLDMVHFKLEVDLPSLIIAGIRKCCFSGTARSVNSRDATDWAYQLGSQNQSLLL